MSTDFFDSVLDLEEKFYKEGYDAGVNDGEHAGLVEGKVFGIEKGYEKALELGRLHGRAVVWQQRLQTTEMPENAHTGDDTALLTRFQAASLPDNTRLLKNVENLLALSDDSDVSTGNSDEAVAAFDDRLTKARMKAKVISNVVDESIEIKLGGDASNTSIEDAKGLKARS